MNRFTQSFFLALLLTGCSSEEDDTDSNPNMGGQFGEETDGWGCVATEEISVTLDETTVLGFSAGEMLDLAQGSHDTTLVWADNTTTPLNLTVANPTNARVILYTFDPGDGGIEPDMACQNALVIDIDLSVSTDDGALAEAWSTELTQWEGGVPGVFESLDELHGSLNIQDWATEDFDSITADLNATFDETGPSGDLSGQGEMYFGDDSDSDSTVMVSRFEIAVFGTEAEW
jgi:hypothetical protein